MKSAPVGDACTLSTNSIVARPAHPDTTIAAEGIAAREHCAPCAAAKSERETPRSASKSRADWPHRKRAQALVNVALQGWTKEFDVVHDGITGATNFHHSIKMLAASPAVPSVFRTLMSP